MSVELEALREKHSDLLTELDDVNSERESLKFQLAETHLPTSSTPLKQPQPPLHFDANAQLEEQVRDYLFSLLLPFTVLTFTFIRPSRTLPVLFLTYIFIRYYLYLYLYFYIILHLPLHLLLPLAYLYLYLDNTLP